MSQNLVLIYAFMMVSKSGKENSSVPTIATHDLFFLIP